MKLRVERQPLLTALQNSAAALPGRTPKPALQCVHLDASGMMQNARLEVSATDLDLALRTTIKAVQIEQPGKACIPADRLLGILRATEAEIIELAADASDFHCTLRAGSDRFKLLGFDPAEFPPVPGFPDKPGFTVKAGALQTLIRRTAFAASREAHGFPAILGVYWRPLGNRLRLAGTDGKRLCEAVAPLPAGEHSETAGVVPMKAMKIIERLLVDPESEVEVMITPNDIRLRCGPSVLCSRLVEGVYPKYQEVIPSPGQIAHTMEADSAALLLAVRKVSVITERGAERLILSARRERLDMRSSAPNGESEAFLPAGDRYSWTGADLRVELNPDYLAEVLRAVGEPRVRLEFVGPEKPVIVRAPDFVGAVMPMGRRNVA